MANVKFNLVNNNKRGDKLITLFFAFDCNRLKYSTGEAIAEKLWNYEDQRVKRSAAGATEINDTLDKLSEDIKRIYRNLKLSGQSVDTFILREKLDEESGKTDNAKPTLFSFIENFIESVSTLRKPATIVVYRTVLKTLREYDGVSKKRVDFDTITLDFYNDFSNFLTKQKHFRKNTIGKHIRTIKTFLNEATERKINKNLDFKSKRFKVPQEETDAIYLSEIEISALYNLELSENKRLGNTRDLFIVGCYTGLRFSDFSQLHMNNIIGGKIKIRTQKTNEAIVIPVHKRVTEILNKYGGELPPTISNQKMNEYLKEIGKLAELETMVEITGNLGGTPKKSFVKKYQLITTHTARRSFASNLFLQGFPAISIMRITGHRTEKAFMRYLKMSPEQNAELLMKFWNTVN